MKSESGRGERKWITVGEAITGTGITETEIGTGKTDTITERGMTIEIAGTTSCKLFLVLFIFIILDIVREDVGTAERDTRTVLW